MRFTTMITSSMTKFVMNWTNCDRQQLVVRERCETEMGSGRR